MSPRLLIIIGVFIIKNFNRQKLGGTTKKNYPSVMEQAVKAVQSGALSLRKAAEIVNVHKSTLYDRVTKRVSLDAKPGGKPVLSNKSKKNYKKIN